MCAYWTLRNQAGLWSISGKGILGFNRKYVAVCYRIEERRKDMSPSDIDEKKLSALKQHPNQNVEIKYIQQSNNINNKSLWLHESCKKLQ